MARLVTATSEGVVLEQEIADAGSRLAAGLIDALILTILGFALVFGVMLIASVDPVGIGGFAAGLVFGGVVLLMMGYHVLFHRFADGRTPGKMLMAIRVVALDGQPPSIVALLVRALIWPLDVFLFLPAPIGLYVIALTPRRQRLGDIAAGTVVVHARGVARSPEPLPNESWSALETRKFALTPASLARLEAPDVELVREILARDSLRHERRRVLAIEAARYYAARLDLGSFEDARDVLREIYLFAREQRASEG